MYCLVSWYDGTTSIECSSGINFKSKHTMIKWSKDNNPYRGKALAVCDDKKFLQRIRIGRRCCLILPTPNNDNPDMSNEHLDKASGGADYQRASHVGPPQSERLSHCRGNGAQDYFYNCYVGTSEDRKVTENGTRGHNDNDYDHVKGEDGDGDKGIDNCELQGVQSGARIVESNNGMIIEQPSRDQDEHQLIDTDIVILSNLEQDFDGEEDRGEDIESDDHDDILIPINDDQSFDVDGNRGEDIDDHVDNIDVLTLVNNDQGFDGHENPEDDVAGDVLSEHGSNIEGSCEERVDYDDDFLILMNDELDFDEDEDQGQGLDNEVDNSSVLKVNTEQALDKDEGRGDHVVGFDGHENAEDDVAGDVVSEQGSNEEVYRRDYVDGDDEVTILLNDEQNLDGNGDRGEDLAGDEQPETGNDGNANHDSHQPGPNNNSTMKPWNQGGRHRVQILPNTSVFIDERELADIMRKYGKEPRQVERKLFLEIIGERYLEKMTRTGRPRKGQEREGCPEDVFNAVKDYMDNAMEDNSMSKAEFKSVLMCLCNRLRNPRR